MLFIAGWRAQNKGTNADIRGGDALSDSINCLLENPPINIAGARPISSPGGKSIMLKTAP